MPSVTRASATVTPGTSSLMMVPVPVAAAPPAGVTVSVNVSFGSNLVSPLTNTLTIFVVSPALKVSAPLTGW